MMLSEDIIFQDHVRAANDYRQKLIAEDQQRASLDKTNTRVPEVPFPIEGVDCTNDGTPGCECADCERSAQESMAEALAEYKPKSDADEGCECGGTLDEYERCDSCDAGHDDCSAQECERCFERAIDRADLAMDAARDAAMGL